MGLFTTVSAPDSAGNMTIWQFKHGLDQCQAYDIGERFGWEVQHNHGEYDCDGVYLGYAGWKETLRCAVVIVKDNAVVAVYPFDGDVIYPNEVTTRKAQQLAECHGVAFDYDEFWF